MFAFAALKLFLSKVRVKKPGTIDLEEEQVETPIMRRVKKEAMKTAFAKEQEEKRKTSPKEEI